MYTLTHWARVTRRYVSNQQSTMIQIMVCRLPGAKPLSEPMSIINQTLGNKLQWNLNRNWYNFIHKNAFQNVVWKMATILSWPQCANVKVGVAAQVAAAWAAELIWCRYLTGLKKPLSFFVAIRISVSQNPIYFLQNKSLCRTVVPIIFRYPRIIFWKLYFYHKISIHEGWLCFIISNLAI